ncbi:MAG: hypothetical protein V7643_4292 [Mycobacterium sp.]
MRNGSFALVRNPIFTAMLVFAAGIMLVTPNPMAIAGFVLLLTTIELQVRRVEEPYLLAVHGDSYRDYTRTVGASCPESGSPAARPNSRRNAVTVEPGVNDHRHANRSAWAVLLLTINQHGAKIRAGKRGPKDLRNLTPELLMDS